MREILFRGKSKDNGEWVYGYFCGKVCDTIFSPEKASAQIIDKDLFWHEVLPETVGQFTGLTDKNGKKIFEGDIVAYFTNTKRATKKEIHEVVFETRHGCGYFGIVISDIETWRFDISVPSKLMVVIGNKLDNPELLEEEE